MTLEHPEELVARHGGDAVRHREREELSPERWAAMRAASDEGWGAGALVEADGGVLLVRQDGRWFLPGGRFEPETDADLAACAEREVREETGVAAEVIDLLAVTERTFVDAADGRAFEFCFATFRAIPETTAVSDDPGLPDEGVDRAGRHDTLPSDTFDRELVARLRG